MFNNINYNLVSSNKRKFEEYQHYGLKCALENGKDLKEVDGTPEEVIIYKALEAGKGMIVEDTSLTVEGSDAFGVHIRWETEALRDVEGNRALWKVMIGVNDGEYIYLFEGKTEGVITIPDKIEGDPFGFSPYFKADGEDKVLHELKAIDYNIYVKNSARKKAVDVLVNGDYYKKVLIKDIPKWNGKWQG